MDFLLFLEYGLFSKDNLNTPLLLICDQSTTDLHNALQVFRPFELFYMLSLKLVMPLWNTDYAECFAQLHLVSRIKPYFSVSDAEMISFATSQLELLAEKTEEVLRMPTMKPGFVGFFLQAGPQSFDKNLAMKEGKC